MKKLTKIKNYTELFIGNVPLLDVRAPIEYEKGSFPKAVNLPIINNEEREKIGTCHKEKGGDKAVEMGHELVNGELKTKRIKTWVKFIKENPNGALFCFRGGLRSRTAQQWIYETTGIDYPLIEGGYKAMRNYLIEFLDSSSKWINPIRIGGRTGVGKTHFLSKIKNHIDLEGIAKHKGSSFGRLIEPQPTQINFENQLAIKLLQHKENGNFPLFLENEGANIGRVYIPKKTYEAFNHGDLLVLEASIEKRMEFTFQEYIIESLSKYQIQFGNEEGFLIWKNSIENSFERIKKRLGDERYRRLKSLIKEAMTEHLETGNAILHKSWIKILLVEYYDSMYDYHIAKSNGRIKFRGNEETLTNYIKNGSF